MTRAQQTAASAEDMREAAIDTFGSLEEENQTLWERLRTREEAAPKSVGDVSQQGARARRFARLAPAFGVLFLMLAGVVAFSLAKKQKLVQHFVAPKPLVALTAPIFDEDLSSHEEDFRESAADFFRHWDFSSSIVRRAFAMHFTPVTPGKKRPTLSPLTLYKRHIDAMNAVRRPDPSDVERCRDYKLDLLLLTGVCNAAAETLKALEQLEEIHRTTNIPVPILGLGSKYKVPSLSEFQEQALVNGLTVADFIGGGKPHEGDASAKAMFTDLADDVANMLGMNLKSGVGAIFNWLGGVDALFRSASLTDRVPEDLLVLFGNLASQRAVLKGLVANALQNFRPFFAAQGLDKKLSSEQASPVRLLYSEEQFDTHQVFPSYPDDYQGRNGFEDVFKDLLFSGGALWSVEELLSHVHSYINENKSIVEELTNNRRDFMWVNKDENLTRDPEDLQSIVRFLL